MPVSAALAESETDQGCLFDFREIRLLELAQAHNQARLADRAQVAQIDGAGPAQTILFARFDFHQRRQFLHARRDGKKQTPQPAGLVDKGT